MSEKENNRIKVDASVEYIPYYKDNWGIIKCSIDRVRSGKDIYKGDLIVFKGQMPEPVKGFQYTIVADFESDPKWGDQYVIQSMYTAIEFGDEDDAGKKKYLSSLYTPYQIECMYKALKDPFEALKKRDMEALVKIKGCALKTATYWCHKFHEHYDRAKIYIELEEYNLTNNVVNRLMATYRSPDLVVDKVKNNPYVLVNEVNGLGWKKADEIALKGGIDPLGETRVAEYIKYYLKRSGDNGMSWLTPDQLLGAILDEIGEEVEDSTITKAIGSLDLWYNNEKTKIGLPYFRDLSKNIATELLRIKNADSDFRYDGWEERIKELEQEQGWEFTDEQMNGIKMGLENNVLVISGGAGCVDCDTEFFTGVEWKRIADYQPGDKVLQYNENGTANLVEPLRYIKQPAQKLYHFETKYGLDQTLSLNHNVYYESCKGVRYLKPLVDIQDKIKQGCFHGKFLTTFNYSGTGINYTDDELRLMVAVFADGSFYGNVKNSPNAKSYKRCRFHLKKKRKKERLEYLLLNLGCSYRKKQSAASGYDDYYVDVKERMKHFPKDWYNCTQHQLKVITDEIVYWDCDYNKKNRYSTNNKEDADFVQFAFSATGRRATIVINDRNGQDYHTCGKAYVRKSIDYGVTWTDRTKIGMTMDHRPDHEITKLNEVKTTDGFEYCFTVPSHLLVLRRNNKVFITGNCGKTSLVGGILAAIPNYSHVMCALSGRASARLAEVTGEEGFTIHRLLGYSGAGFEYDQDNQLRYDIYILDEISMVDAELFYYLIRAIPSGSKIIMLGDPAQLEAIGCGNVAYDMINSPEIPDILLTKIHRQAAKSAIITNSTAVRHGEQIVNKDWSGTEVRGELKDLILDCYLDSSNSFYKVMEYFQRLYAQKDFDIMETQIIVPIKKRGTANTYTLNNDIQELYNPARDGLKEEPVMTISSGLRIFRVGDKVINTVNNYKVEPTVYNGNIGIIKDITIEENEEGDVTDVMVIDFVGIGRVSIPKDYWDQLDLAYAMTAHKCVTKDTYIYSDQGILPITELTQYSDKEDIIKNINIYNGDSYERPIKFYDVGMQECRRIRTKRGYQITGTLDHGLDVLCEDGRIHRKDIGDIQLNDYVVLSKNMQVYGNKTDLPVEWYDLHPDVRSVIYDLPKTLDEDFAQFLGHMVADGCICHGGFRCVKNQEEVVQEFVAITERLFHCPVQVKKVIDGVMGGMYQAEVCSQYIKEFLLKIEGLAPHKKDVPDCIMMAPENIQCSFLKGFFEDGTVNLKKGKFDHIEIVQTTYGQKINILYKVQQMLLNMGIISSLKVKTDNSDRTVCYLYIYKQDAIIFQEKIGFISFEKKDRLLKATVITKHTCSNKTIPYIRPIMKSLIERYNIKLPHNLNNQLLNKCEITDTYLNKYLNAIKDIVSQDSDYQYLNMILNNKYIEKVADIEDNLYERVYCIEMPDTHKFVQNGFDGWNCQGSQFDNIIFNFDFASYSLLTRQLIYTGITRAKKKCYLVCQTSALRYGVAQEAISRKQTHLQDSLYEVAHPKLIF